MDFSVYTQPRKFRNPYLQTAALVGVGAVLWTLIAGPLYLWRKGAMVEALALGIAGILPFLPIDGDDYALDGIASAVWLGGALLAPVLLAMSYERRGWIDVTGRSTTLLDDDEDWSRDPRDRE